MAPIRFTKAEAEQLTEAANRNNLTLVEWDSSCGACSAERMRDSPLSPRGRFNWPHQHRVRVRCAHTPYCLSYTAVLLTFLPDESVPVCLRVTIAAESPSTQGKKCGITPSERGQ